MLRLLLLSLILSSLFAYPSLAAEEIKPEDAVSIDISAENWVTSKTAHVTLDAEAAVSPANAGSVRTEMMQAVGNAAKADWRMTNFNRTQDQTGMERWSVTFDARLAESDLNGLPDAVKKASKAGLQIRLDTIDFTPTVEETETARAALRTKLYKDAVDQLAALNAAIPGRNYRIGQIDFNAQVPVFAQVRPMVMGMASSSIAASPSAEPEHAQKLIIDAHVVFVAAPITAQAH